MQEMTIFLNRDLAALTYHHTQLAMSSYLLGVEGLTKGRDSPAVRYLLVGM
jgi:hypothetical protein